MKKAQLIFTKDIVLEINIKKAEIQIDHLCDQLTDTNLPLVKCLQ